MLERRWENQYIDYRAHGAKTRQYYMQVLESCLSCTSALSPPEAADAFFCSSDLSAHSHVDGGSSLFIGAKQFIMRPGGDNECVPLETASIIAE